MKVVYRHSEKIKSEPERVAAAQALTLNLSKPMLGLKGTNGLYGSLEWWRNIENGLMPFLCVSGIIVRIYFSGQDNSHESNTMDLLLDNGSIFTESIYVNDKSDIKLFRQGCRVEITYVLDELKKQPAPNGKINYLEIPLEVSISLEAIDELS